MHLLTQESFSTNNGIDTPALVWESSSEFCAICTSVDGIASVSGRPDDAEENVQNGNIYLASSDLELVHDSWRQDRGQTALGTDRNRDAGHDEQLVGIVFPAVDIGAGAFVDNAYVLFDIDEVEGQSDAWTGTQPSEATMLTIYGEKNANAAAPTDTNKDLSNRTPTAAAVSWSPEPSVNVHDELVTPDISSIVNEIVGMPGWNAGNSMGILFGHVSGTGARWVESSSTNNGVDTPALVYSVTTCTGGTAGPPVDGMASVSGRPDGAEENVGNGNMYLTSSDYEVR